MKRLFTVLVFTVLSANSDATTTLIAGIPTSGPISRKDTVGYAFSVGSQNLNVDALGVYDAYGDGLRERNRVGIWDGGGNLITSVYVSKGTASPLGGSYRWVSAPTGLILQANTNYYIGAFAIHEYGESFGGAFEDRLMGSISLNNQVTLIGMAASLDDASFRLPNGILSNHPSNAGQGIIGPNISYTAVPEPSSLSLLLVGGAVLAAFRRRKC
jgi:hypothetical protein